MKIELINKLEVLEGILNVDTYSNKQYAKQLLQEIKEQVINYTPCCKSDSEQCCEPVGEGFYLGTSCPKCKQPFRQNLK